MRKLIVSMNVTLDGFIAGPDCELDWHFKFWTREMAESLCEELGRADAILLGRITYKAMAKYWPYKARDMSFPREDIVFAEMMNSYAKFVFSGTLENTDWSNSTLIRGNIAKEIAALKQRRGKNIIVYGSGKIVSALTALALVDEYQLWIHPVVLGKGKRLFTGLTERVDLKLCKIQRFDSGVMLLYCESITSKFEWMRKTGKKTFSTSK